METPRRMYGLTTCYYLVVSRLECPFPDCKHHFSSASPDFIALLDPAAQMSFPRLTQRSGVHVDVIHRLNQSIHRGSGVRGVFHDIRENYTRAYTENHLLYVLTGVTMKIVCESNPGITQLDLSSSDKVHNNFKPWLSFWDSGGRYPSGFIIIIFFFFFFSRN